MNMGTQLTRSGAFSNVKTLDDVVKAYWDLFDKSKQGEAHDDPVVEFCREAPNLRLAISRAVDGRRKDGKMFSKGTCVRASSKLEMTNNLLRAEEAISQHTIFDNLYDAVDRASPWGIGRMTKYAVTERIGAFLKVYPKDYLYLHAGPLQGWKKLTGIRGNPYRVPWNTVPASLRTIPNYHVENLLCEFRELLRPEMIQ
jgi:hypothetical protein